jgi:hypothetical protein
MENAKKVIDWSIIALIGMGGGVALAGAISVAVFFLASAVILAVIRMFD